MPERKQNIANNMSSTGRRAERRGGLVVLRVKKSEPKRGPTEDARSSSRDWFWREWLVVLVMTGRGPRAAVEGGVVLLCLHFL